MTSVYLESERLILREFTPDDVDNLVELDSDPEVMRYLTDGEPSAREYIETQSIPRILDWYRRKPGFGFWAAIEKSTGEFIGWFHFRPDARNEADTELGYRLKRSAWSKGYATEMSRALIEKGFRELGVTRVTARTLLANQASQKVMRKLGMTYECDFEEEVFPGSDKRGVRFYLDPPDCHR
jgi:RimJ/RimL family protein N-acetyltransferase